MDILYKIEPSETESSGTFRKVRKISVIHTCMDVMTTCDSKEYQTEGIILEEHV